jgi:hypothetical protein
MPFRKKVILAVATEGMDFCATRRAALRHLMSRTARTLNSAAPRLSPYARTPLSFVASPEGPLIWAARSRLYYVWGAPNNNGLQDFAMSWRFATRRGGSNERMPGVRRRPSRTPYGQEIRSTDDAGYYGRSGVLSLEAIRIQTELTTGLFGHPKGSSLRLMPPAAYPHPRIIPILAYGLASVVVVAQVGARCSVYSQRCSLARGMELAGGAVRLLTNGSEFWTTPDRLP